MTEIKKDILHGVKWTSLGSAGNTLMNFIFGIVLARLLFPSDYGVVGMTVVFFAIANIFVDGGFPTYLVRKDVIKDEDTSTCFWFNVGMGFSFLILFVFIAPWIAHLLNHEEITNIIRLSALALFIKTFCSVHTVLLKRALNFRPLTIVGLGATLVSGIVGIVLAYLGYGYWALVWQQFLSACITSVALCFIVSWRPKFIFSKVSFKEMFGFGSNLVINSILDKLYNEGVGTFMGKHYSTSDLGFFTKGQKNAQIPANFLYGVVEQVSFPVLAKLQDNEERLNDVYNKYIRSASVVIFFALFMIAALAKPLVIFLYSHKWDGAIIFLQLFCIQYMFFHVHAINWNFILVKGRTDIALKKELINKGIRFAILAFTLMISPVAIAIGMIVGSFFDLLVNSIFTKRITGIGVGEQFNDFIIYFVIACVANIPAYLLTFAHLASFVTLIIGGIISIVCYSLIMWIRNDHYFFMLLRLTPLMKVPAINKILSTKN